MKYEIEVEFSVGDIAWCKNLVTNEAYKTKILSYQAIIDSSGSKCVIYHCEEGTHVNVNGKPKNTNLFKTKEECDSFPPYIPYNN